MTETWRLLRFGRQQIKLRKEGGRLFVEGYDIDAEMAARRLTDARTDPLLDVLRTLQEQVAQGEQLDQMLTALKAEGSLVPDQATVPRVEAAIAPAFLAAMAHSKRDDVLSAVMRNARTPTWVAEELLRRCPREYSLVMAAMERPDMDDSDIEIALSHFHYHVQEAGAKHPNLSLARLQKLVDSGTEHMEVWRAIVNHPKATPDMIEKAALHHRNSIRALAAASPLLSAETAVRLVDDDSLVCQHLAENPIIPPEVQYRLADVRGWTPIRIALARNRSLCPEVEAMLRSDPEKTVRATVVAYAGDRTIPASVLRDQMRTDLELAIKLLARLRRGQEIREITSASPQEALAAVEEALSAAVSQARSRVLGTEL